MNILVINASSSSLKYQLIDSDGPVTLAKGLCERVGCAEPCVKHGADTLERIFDQRFDDHEEALGAVLAELTEGEKPAVASLDEIDAIGHRVLHGGDVFSKSVLIDDDVIAKIDGLSELAPLHNPPALACIDACKKLLPGLPQVAVFDTAFFQTLPPSTHMYPLPYEVAKEHRIRKYGAHGTSHRYIAQRCAALLGQHVEDLKIVTCHLGNGCSMAAVDHGIAVDTSMGFTPLDGLMMGTRCGSIDPAIVTYLIKAGYSADEVEDIMNRQSGLLGISGISNDVRDITEAASKGDARASLAYDMYAHSIRKYLGQYIVEMAGVDAIVLTAGVGENAEIIRRRVFAGLQPLGIILDQEKNRTHNNGHERIISRDDSPVKIIVIPAGEEYMIAADTQEIVSSL
ncbi:acetate/propionate family kinase [Slackia heliotrinireducens]|uniref:acetate/propionate family kinase n=1 Tax=Slackia heliotrinireducens TaxID=84110 RepID=UPI0033154520